MFFVVYCPLLSNIIVGLLNEVAPSLGDGGGSSVISDMENEKAEIVVASLVSIAIEELFIRISNWVRVL